MVSTDRHAADDERTNDRSNQADLRSILKTIDDWRRENGVTRRSLADFGRVDFRGWKSWLAGRRGFEGDTPSHLITLKNKIDADPARVLRCCVVRKGRQRARIDASQLNPGELINDGLAMFRTEQIGSARAHFEAGLWKLLSNAGSFGGAVTEGHLGRAIRGLNRDGDPVNMERIIRQCILRALDRDAESLSFSCDDPEFVVCILEIACALSEHAPPQRASTLFQDFIPRLKPQLVSANIRAHLVRSSGQDLAMTGMAREGIDRVDETLKDIEDTPHERLCHANAIAEICVAAGWAEQAKKKLRDAFADVDKCFDKDGGLIARSNLSIQHVWGAKFQKTRVACLSDPCYCETKACRHDVSMLQANQARCLHRFRILHRPTSDEQNRLPPELWLLSRSCAKPAQSGPPVAALQELGKRLLKHAG